MNSDGPNSGFNLSRWAIENPSVTRFLMAVIFLAGVFGLLNIGQKEDPDFTFRVMIVQAVWPGASLQDMQDQVVNKIERKLQETPHLDYVSSFTRAGSAMSSVNIKGDAIRRASDGRLLSGAQEDRRHRQRAAAGPARALFQRRIRRHLHHLACDHRRRLQLSGAEGLRQGRARLAVARARASRRSRSSATRTQKIHIDVSSKVLAERGHFSPTTFSARLAGQNMSTPPARVETASPLRARVRRRRSAQGRPTSPISRLRSGGQMIRLGDIAKVERGLEDPVHPQISPQRPRRRRARRRDGERLQRHARGRRGASENWPTFQADAAGWRRDRPDFRSAGPSSPTPSTSSAKRLSRRSPSCSRSRSFRSAGARGSWWRSQFRWCSPPPSPSL